MPLPIVRILHISAELRCTLAYLAGDLYVAPRLWEGMQDEGLRRYDKAEFIGGDWGL
jgi:hypothetical protein